MRLGLVEIARLEQRRDNPRAMSEQEYETLKRSMDRFGFKSFIVVEEIEPGRFGVVDGHHRWRAAQEQGRGRVPVVLLDAQPEKAWMDLAMLTFNVTGEPVDAKYVDLLAELTQTLGATTTADFTALDPDFLSSFAAQLVDAPILDTPTGNNDTPTGLGGWKGHPIAVEFPRTEATQALFDTLVQRTGESVLSQAILRAVESWLKTPENAQVMGEEDE